MGHGYELIGIKAVAVAIVGANVFFPVIRARRRSGAPIHFGFPWHGKGAWIINGDCDLDTLAVIVESIAFDHMQLLCMGRPVAIERALVVQSDSVDDQR